MIRPRAATAPPVVTRDPEASVQDILAVATEEFATLGLAGARVDQIAEKLNHRSLIVILSDFFDDIDSIKSGLRHLRYKKHEVMAFQILDPGRRDLEGLRVLVTAGPTRERVDRRRVRRVRRGHRCRAQCRAAQPQAQLRHRPRPRPLRRGGMNALAHVVHRASVRA